MKYNKKSILKSPVREWNKITSYKQIVIIPTRKKHESGYALIAIVGMKENGRFEICSYADDICWDFRKLHQNYDSSGMRTDCYYPEGILHFWGRNIEFIVHEALSSTTIEIVNVPG